MKRIIFCVLLVLCGYLNACNSSTQTSGKLLESGLSIYRSYCASCHGSKGNAGIGGAKNLTTAIVSAAEATAIITNGKGAMKQYGNQLTKEQIDSVVVYVIGLRK